MLCLNSGLVACSEESLDSFVPKSLDRHSRKCNLYGYKPQARLRTHYPWRGSPSTASIILWISTTFTAPS